MILGSIILGIIYWWNEIINFVKIQITIYKFARSLPGPRALPLIGNALSFINTDDTVDILAEWSRKISKTYRVYFGPVLKIVLTDPRDIEILFASPNGEEKDSLYDLMRTIVKNSMIYRSHKKLVMPIVNGKPLSIFVEKGNKFSRKFVEVLNDKVGKEEFDMHHIMAPCVCDLVFETLYGVPGEAQNGKPNIFVYGVEKLLHILHQRMVTFWLYPNFIFKFSKIGKSWFSIGIEPNVPVALCDKIIDHIMKTNSWTDRELHDELTTIFIGSHDTMVGVGSFVFLMLAMYPEIQDKVRQEIESIAGNEIVTYDMCTDMKYMDMVIRETMRLFPAGPFLPRKITGDIKLATCTIPKGCSVIVLAYAVHRDPDYWPEPNKFNPENHTVENTKARHPSAFLPFSGGIRACPGYKYGMALLKVIITDVVRNYKLSTTTTMESIKLNAHISVRSRNGINISITKIKP
ncbi:cytochrome P450 4C1-like [Aphidius gifuensis]|uniref:cytochrome P450 4C1-like n=1 Tax=Aphidius gifuensis TaxID=684658 RepID=UPI001CDD1DA3|nr:cytochrome P450 4C1-like [Aphidius gifuensis]